MCTRMHEWRIQVKPIGQVTDQSLGQLETVNLGDLTYRSGHGQGGMPEGGDLTYRLKPERDVTEIETCYVPVTLRERAGTYLQKMMI